MAKRRTHHARRNKTPLRSGPEHARNGSAARAPTFADVLKSEEPDPDVTPAAPRQADKPLLEAWPPGYEKGGFRLVPGGVLIFAKGRPALRIEEGGRIAKSEA